MINQQLKGWNESDTVDYYINNRQNYKDLYDSEKYFITYDFMNSILSVLDIGCAAGGMSKIFHDMNNNLKYTGLDVADNLIQYAQKNLSSELSEFHCYDGINMPFSHKKFDLTFCSGVLHLIDNYQDVFRQIIERSSKYILADFRVTSEQTYMGKMKFNFSDKEEVKNVTNYHVINFNELLFFFKQFSFIKQIEVFGYKGDSSSMSEGVVEVYMVFLKFYISENENNDMKVVFLDDELKKVFDLS